MCWKPVVLAARTGGVINMKFRLKGMRFALFMSLFTVALVACSAAVVGDSQASNPEAAVADPALIDDQVEDPAPESTTEEELTTTVKEGISDGDSAESTVVAQEPEAEPTANAEQSDGGTEGTQEGQESNDVEESAVEDTGTEVSDSMVGQDDSGDENGEPGDSAAEEEITEDGIMTSDNRSERQRQISAGWKTDFNRHTVPYDEMLALLPVRDGIIPIDFPTFETLEEASLWLAEKEPVIALEIDGDARAYPLQILTWHEIVNDTVGELPVIVTFCPLCNSALVFDRRLNGEVYDFGTSGWLRHSDLIMWDRQTESLWQQFTGEGIVGELAGEQLTFLASSIISFADFAEAYPEGIVLSQRTGFGRPYGQNPYPGYDRIGQDPFAFIGVPDRRIAAMERVVTVSFDDIDVAYPLKELADAGVINDSQGEHDLVIFHKGGTASALDLPVIAFSADVGATGVFEASLNGELLTFVKDGDVILDEQTGSTWNIVGRAVDGPLAGEQLVPIVHGDHFWFSWAAFKPDTVIYGS